VGKDNARFIRGTQNFKMLLDTERNGRRPIADEARMMIRGVRLTKNDIDQFICDDERQFSEAV
jgi:hypothetical protein